MKEKIIKILPLLILLIFFIELFFYYENLYSWLEFSFKLCFYNLFPYLYPIMILSSLLIEYNFNEIANILFKPLMKLFKINSVCSQVFALSMISGCPSNAKYIKELYDKKLINEHEVQKILFCTHFNNPIFIISTIGITFLNKELGILILICHYLGNIIVGLIFRNYYPSLNNTNMPKSIKNDKTFIQNLVNSINNTTSTLLVILGVISMCTITINILINTLNIDGIIGFILSGFLEITQGIKNIGNTNLSYFHKGIIFISFISFGGISIHAQVMSILNNKKIRYFPYLFSRIIHSIISTIFFIISYKLFL